MQPKALLAESARLLEQVMTFEHPADAVVSRFFREHHALGPRDRTVVADTVFNVLRWRLRLEAQAREGSGSRWRRLAILGFAGDRSAMQATLDEPEQAWLKACGSLDEAALPRAQHHNLPPWLADALQTQLGDAFDALAASLLQPAPLDLRVNPMKARREAVAASLREAGLESEPTPHAPWGLRLHGKPSVTRLPVYFEGGFEVQDEGSQLLALLLEARRGEVVADFCAGAGGKTLALGALMRNSGRLYAFDTSAHRLDALQPRLARSGLDIVHTMAIAHERDARLARLAGKVDRVLVDAPCSGLGTLRRSPDLKWRMSASEVAALAQRQLDILQAAARLLKPGGRLVYATCSLLREENESVVEAFETIHPSFQPVPAVEALRVAKVPAAETLVEGASGRFLRLWPHLHGTDGFFAALWRKAP